MHVVFTPEAEQQLLELQSYLAEAASIDVATRYTEAVVDSCEGLATFPTGVHQETTYAQAFESPIIEAAR